MVFNVEAARAIRVTDELHKKRAEEAAALMRECMHARPMPEQQQGQSVQEWEGRMIQSHHGFLANREQVLEALGPP
jgi:hypothetical protein